MTKPFREEIPVSVLPWVSLAERLIVVIVVLPTCHLIWTLLLSSWQGLRSELPLFHVLVADWIIRPRLLLILTAVFVAGFVWAAFAKEGGRKMLAVLKVMSTLVIVLVLCLSAIAFAALLFPIKGMSPEVRRNHYVYAMQDGATVDEIQRRIGEMGFANFMELSNRLVVESDGNETIEALANVQRAIGRLRGYQYVLREKDGARSVTMSLLCPDGDLGTVINVLVGNGTITVESKEISPEAFQDHVRAALAETGGPLRIYFRCRGDKIRDLLDAAELLDVEGLKANLDPDLRFALVGEDEAALFGGTKSPEVF